MRDTDGLSRSTPRSDPASDVDRRAATFGLAAAFGASATPSLAQVAGVEVLAAGRPGDGNDQLARALAEGLGTTLLVPRAVAVDVPNEATAVNDFVQGKRPRAGLMVLGLSTIGVMLGAKTDESLGACRPIGLLTGERQPIVVPAASPLRAISDLMRALAVDSSQVSWGGRARFGADHQLCLQLIRLAGGDVGRVSYRPFATSAEVSTKALVGELTVASGALSDFLQQIRGGTMRALALASPERAPGVDVPTLRELGVELAQTNWRGVVTRDAVGSAMIGRFIAAVPRVAQSAGWRQMMGQRYWEDVYQPPEAFGRHIEAERRRVAALLKDGRVL